MTRDAIQRRAFIKLLGGATATSPFATPATAQQTGRLATIGFLGTATPTAWGPWVTASVQRPRETGWMEGRNLAIEYRWAEGRVERYSEFSTELVRLKVDVIVTSSAPAVIASKQATSAIPIVFAVANDPVGNNLVASLARPGGNVTGLSTQSTDLVGKRLEIFREVLPGVRSFAILGERGNLSSVLEAQEFQAAARTLGLEVIALEIQRGEEIAATLDTLKGRADALYIPAGPLVASNGVRINTLVLGARLPTMHGSRENVEAGGLVSYGPHYPAMFRRAADFVDKILRGTKPADIPVEQPTRFELAVNLTTAKALGLTNPETFLVRADEVIE